LKGGLTTQNILDLPAAQRPEIINDRGLCLGLHYPLPCGMVVSPEQRKYGGFSGK